MDPKNDPRPHYTAPVRNITKSDAEALVRLALREDAPEGDATSDSIFDPDHRSEGRIVAREAGVACGIELIEALLEIDAEEYPPKLSVEAYKRDGEAFAAGDALLQLAGPTRTLLRLERILLNFLQYLSGIASQTARARELAGERIFVLDTRKTVPGYRRLAKYAVYCGGGTNHRITLSDMAMIKDNHVAAAGGIAAAAGRVRAARPELPLEIEVDSLGQVEEALAQNPRAILLDNFNAPDLEAAVALIRRQGGATPPLIEVSGGRTPEQLADLAPLGPLGVSMGYLTHTTRFLDLSLEMQSLAD